MSTILRYILFALFVMFIPMLSIGEDQLQFSGIYPHLAFYNQENECGVGAVVPWAGKLWAITYGPHRPFGSSDKLYEIDSDLNRIIRPESIGGTHANRFIHRESQQMIMGDYFIDKDRNVRVVSPKKMPGRMTGNARHLFDPENKIYFASMEEGFYEVDVHTLDVKVINLDGNATDPPNIAGDLLPGYHGKGFYSSQDRVVYANNGERSSEALRRPDLISGCLAEWDGETWNVVARKQFCEVTGPGGIDGPDSNDDPIWTYGWDDHSAIFMLLDGGEWYRFRMPKATHTYDGAHGWNTEWPRIREVEPDFYLMTMHGMFWSFPKTFSKADTSGIRPLSTYLKIIGDFCGWEGKIVCGCDDAAKSAFHTKGVFPIHATLVGQSNSNLWFLDKNQLDDFGNPIGRGAVWKNDSIKANEYSDPYYFAGFDHRAVHITHTEPTTVTFTFEVDLKGNGQWSELETIEVPASGYKFHRFKTKGEWIRVKTDTDCKSATVFYQFADKNNRSKKPADKFKGLAKADTPFSTGLIRPRGEDKKTLHFAATHVKDGKAEEIGYYEIGEDMKLQQKNDPQAHKWLKETADQKEVFFITDEASVLVTDARGNRYRLPKGPASMQKSTPAGWPRCFREIVTERNIFNCQGHVYELPRQNAGGFPKIRPIATSDYLLMDICSWRGMMIIAGIADKDVNNSHIIQSNDGECALWFGTIDDLWGLGKPRGEGGPWKNTPVKSNEPSDPYLMTGYDQKSITLSHQSNQPVTITIEVDFSGDGDWVAYRSFEIKPNQTKKHKFPRGFNAYWLRVKSSTDTTATAQLTYQ